MKTLKLKRPLMLLFVYDGIEREEAVSILTLKPRSGGYSETDIEATRDLHLRAEPTVPRTSVQDLCCYDVVEALKRATIDAADRARGFCHAKGIHMDEDVTRSVMEDRYYSIIELANGTAPAKPGLSAVTS